MVHRMTVFDRLLCYLFLQFEDVDDKDCEDVTTMTSPHPNRVAHYFRKCYWCNAQWLPYVYWFAIRFCLLGVLWNMIDLILVVGNVRSVIPRPSRHEPVPIFFWAKCSLLNAFVMVLAWVGLLQTVVNASPERIPPWLAINLMVIMVEVAIWLVNILKGYDHFRIENLCIIAVPLMNIAIVSFLQRNFLEALAQEDLDEVYIASIFNVPGYPPLTP